MLFALRGLAVSLAFFAICYCFFSLLLSSIWELVERSRRVTSISANWLFGLRILPFVLSSSISLFFTLPSFFLFENHALDEDGETLALAACGLLLLVAGVIRVLVAHRKTSRTISPWLAGAKLTKVVRATPVVVTKECAPPVILAGLRRPQVLVSRSAHDMLSDSELAVAVRHEIEHARALDNLKKVAVNCLPFVGMTRLEQRWQEAAEFAADEAAIENRTDALDLAAALIKLSRSFPARTIPAFATGFAESPADLTNRRVQKLLAWKGGDRAASSRLGGTLVLVALLGIVVLAANIGPVLIFTHSLTERLVP